VPYTVVVYDVSDDQRRLRLSRTLEAWGLSRIQRSAFTGRMQRARIRDLALLAERLIDPGTDVVHVFQLSREEWSKTIVLGTPRWGVRSVEGVLLLR